ncbi:MAG: glycosyl hydrolase family 18 protein [Asticcacaulis sp.]
MSLIRTVCLGLLLASTAMPAEARPMVEAYLPGVRGLSATLRTVDISPYSHIALAFINPDASGRLVNGDAMACMAGPQSVSVSVAELRASVALIHQAGRKAIGAIGGGIIPQCAGDWADLASPAKREATVAQLAAFADDYRLDGLVIDIESDLLARMVHEGTYTPFVTRLSARLHAHHKTLSGTTSSWVGGMIPLSAIPAFDTVEVMSYDNPLPGGELASLAKFKSELYLWLGRGVAKDRLVMGLPFFARGYGTYRPAYAWRDLDASFGGQARSADLIGRICAGCSYITFNSPATLEEKAQWAGARAGGVMAWEITGDTPDGALIHAVRNGLNAAPPAPQPAAPAMAAQGRPLNTPDVRAWTIYGAGVTYGLADAPGLPHGNALRLTVARPTENSWDIGVSAPVSDAVKAGDTVDFAVWARLKANDPATQLDIPAVVQLAAAPYTPLIEGTLTVTAQWQWLHLRGVMAEDHPAGTLSAALQLGNAAKTIELGPAIVTNVSP